MDLCAFCDDEGLPPLVQAAIAHAQFETIHPFDDGNGRTGRALIQIILRRRGLAPAFVPPISVILARDKGRYIKGLTLFREDRLAEWLDIFAVAANHAAGLAIRYGLRVGELQQAWRQKLGEHSNPRSDAGAWAIIDMLPAHPIITVPVAVAATRRTKPAVTNAIAELERAGYDTAFSFESSHDPFLPLALASELTERLRLGTAVAIGFARNPMVLANIGYDLQSISGGRLAWANHRSSFAAS